MTTIKDVAKEAGVAVATVSRVLNNRGYLSDSTRKKVYEAMERLNYKPNEISRSLFRKKSNILGVIVPSVSHPFFSELVGHIEYFAYQAGYKVLICNSYADNGKEREYLEMISSNQVDGFIGAIYTSNSDDYIKPDMPLVTLDMNINGLPYITSDHYNGGEIATNFLIDRGCKKIAHICGDLEIDILANNRSKAFINVTKKQNINSVLEESKLSRFDEYKKTVIKMFEEHPEIDGVFASSDIIAASVIHVAGLNGKSIPEDIKIVGYDDIDMAAMTVPPITTIKQDIEKIGELAVKTLLNKIEGKEVTLENILPVELVERETT
nr:LacI family DNA-binding transcriptional regulator [uncultured Planococcus sp.]